MSFWNTQHEEECQNLANRLSKPMFYISCIQRLCKLWSSLKCWFDALKFEVHYFSQITNVAQNQG